MSLSKKIRRQAALERQQGRLARRLVRLRRLSDRLGWTRLGLFVAGIGTSAALFWMRGTVGFVASALLWAAAFFAVVAWHGRVEEAIARHAIWQERVRVQLARMALVWEALPPAHGRPRPEHPFEADFDLVGVRSLHRLLDSAVTREGSERLRAWLVAPVPDGAVIGRRQALVRELAPLHGLRSRLALQGRLAAGGEVPWQASELQGWFAGHGPLAPRWAIVATSVLAGFNALLLPLDLLLGAPPLWWGTLALYAAIYLLHLTRLAHLFDEAVEMRATLARMVPLFRVLERRSYTRTPHLAILCAPFTDPLQRPSHFLARAARVVNAAGLGGNPLVHLLLNLLLPWDFLVAWRLEAHRHAIAERLPRWLDVWWELEALGSLANLLYLNPHYTLPHLVPEARLVAERIGHPLLPDAQKVRNDFEIEGTGQITLVTGSNMAGKSSFLRTIGSNMALAYAGGPVDAQRLQLALFRPVACIRVSDSVTDGISYFYAEVRCLRALLDAVEADHPLPVFFFIDEIFRGTNNRERLLGSRAFLRELATRPALGLVATHDLELTQLADTLPGVRNVHFRETVEGDRMIFDYRLRPGPSPTTNALLIMARAGLPVPGSNSE